MIADWSTLLFEAINLPALALALVGAIRLSMRRIKLAIWLIGNAIMFQLLALQYSYSGLEAIGEFSPYAREYYLPSFICLVVLTAWGIDGILGWMRMNLARLRMRDLIVATIPSILTGLMLIPMIGDLAARHPTDLIDRSSEIQAKWAEIKKFPPDQNAALVAHWGDLTALWYLQHAEGWRSDLIAIHPPDEMRVNEWIDSGKPLYLAGSLLGWAPSISKNYSLTAWGQLVRVTNEEYSPPSPLTHNADWIFVEDRPVLRLLGYQVSSEVVHSGETLELDLYWECLETISFDDYLIYLSLEDKGDSTPAKDFALAVNWLPVKRFNPGQRALSIYRYPIPGETTAGLYGLQLLLYSIRNSTNLRATGNVSGDRLEITQINIDRTTD